MKLVTRVNRRGDDLVIVIPKIVVNNGGLRAGLKLDIILQGGDICIRNIPDSDLGKRVRDSIDDVYSKILTEEELMLAK